MTDARWDSGDVERYEQLRSHALVGEPSGFTLGLALLERRGMAAWAHAWRTTAPARAARAPEIQAVPTKPVGDELVGALASMALARVAAG
jgi:hypothetical protein